MSWRARRSGFKTPIGSREIVSGIDALFAYGTLRCQEIMRAVCGQPFVGRAATLENYRVLKVRGEVYPGMIKSPGFVARGVVYQNIGARHFEALDAFEGEMYEKQRIQIQLEDGDTGTAFAYLVKESYEKYLEPVAWSYTQFIEVDKKQFVRMGG
jgi:gamma-glutamylcyclotransferase (GGCT)/AIG2-like uncharacterized protein YtfP